MPFKKGFAKTKTSFQKGNKRSPESIEKQKRTIKTLMEQGDWRDMDELHRLCNTPEANAKKSGKGPKSPRWIKDRSKLKGKRCQAEERWFFQEVIQERDYICELTGQKGGHLSVHHIKPVWKYPELRFDKSNVIVISLDIHLRFHRIHGLKGDEIDWNIFIEEATYSIPQ